LLAGAAYWLVAPQQPRPDPGLSVLLISIDTLRADALGAYGRAGAQTPWMDRLAREGVRFAAARAHNVVTLPSHANLLSGLHPHQHGVRDNSGFRFPQGLPTLATLLKAHGHRTGAFVSAFVLDARFGLDRGFDVYDDRLGGGSALDFQVQERPGPLTVEAARRWLERQAGSPSFALVHLYEPHFPYEPPEPLAARFREEPYHGEVAAADAALEPLLRPLLEAGERSRTLVVLTSDHGEALGEHGEETHGLFAYEPTLRVPLVLWAPGLLRPRVVTDPVHHVDLLPTVLEALGLDPPAGLPGRSLLGAAVGRRLEAAPTYFEALSASLNRGWAPLYGVVEGALKYVELPLPELYDLSADPAEAANLAASQPGQLERLRRRLAGFRAEDRGAAPVAEDRATLEGLRALGYLGGGAVEAKPRYTEDDDPKRLVGLDRKLSDIITLYNAGRFDEAVELCRGVIAARPDMPLAHMQLASIERARGDLAAAVEAAKVAVALRPLDAESAALLGAYLVEAGRAAEARDLLAPHAARDQPDLDVLNAYGMALAHEGRASEALAAFERIRALHPGHTMALVNTATVHMSRGEVQVARRALTSAIELDPRLARAHNGLGVLAAREQRLDEAVEHWKRAATLDPRDYQTLFNLGATLRQLGRAGEARPFLEAYLREAPPALEARDIARVRGWLE
jgi:choline-sulfatase